MKANIMILTADNDIKTFLMTELAKNGFPVNTKLNSVFHLPNFLDPTKVNVLILDADTITAPPEGIKTLTERHSNLFVILLGIKNAAPFLLGGVKGALSKPEPRNDFSHRVFLRNILDRVELFVRNASTSNIIDTSQAAGINDTVIAIASSTGGTEALSKILPQLPHYTPPLLIVQHMPSVFTHQFAERLNKSTRYTVKEAATREYVLPNQALIAPGDLHMKAVKQGLKLTVECFRG
ncbi:MAG: hypothetical protein FWC67_00660, partial [Defluviitaleaceae bacterium]|nr:hypothetical protein [Defluviitaleaceae bacterium]